MVAIDENPVAAGRRRARALARHSAGRQISDTVTTLGTGLDGSVRRIDTTYNAQGLAYQLTSYADTAGTQIVNQVENIYNGLGQLAFQYEALTGAVDLATTPVVQYTYTTLGTGSLLSSMVYPNGRTITYSYGSGLSNTNAPLDQAIGWLDAIVDGAGSSDAGQVLEQYSYLGLSTIVARNHPQTGINLSLLGASGAIGSGGDQYVGLDRFGRVVDQNWVNAAGTTVDGYTYSYDGDSNVTAKNNTLDSAYSQGFTYDPLNRLTAATQGGSAYQSWNLDSQGNWSSFTSGTTTQSESANAQNQITSISGSATPTYDANGNMISDQNGNAYVFDAWNRLVEVKNAAGTVIAQYSYDARGYRITESYPQGGNGVAAGTTNYIYYDADWQAIETRTNGTSASNVTSQMVWSAAYINAAVLQDSYSGGTIQPNSRLYFTQDANWDTTAVVGYNSTTQTWGVVQRYVYSPYGNITVLNADWSTPPAGTQPLVNNLYQGMTLDAVTGLYYERNRDYSPSLGRWMEQDPAQYINGANTYQFVDSSPVGNVDASGLWYQFSEGGYTFNSNGNPATSSITPSHPVLAPPPSPWLGLPGELPNAITPHNLGVGAEDTAQGVQNGLIGAANLVADVLSPAGISAQLNQLIKAIRGQPLRLSAFFPTLINSPQWDHNNPYNDPTKSISETLGSVFGPMAIPVVGELLGDLGAAESTVTSGGAADAFQYQSLKMSLANQQALGEASSAFTESGGLSQGAINGSKMIFKPGELGNPAIPSSFGKFTTQTFDSPAGPFQVHFYMSPTTGEIYYGLDYKAVFNAPGGN